MGASRAAGAHGGSFIRRLHAGRLTTEGCGSIVDGASAFIIFNGIATSLCIVSCVSPLHKRNLATFVDDKNYRALMDINISFLSTSMIGFECIWTGVFTTLQMGTYYYHDCLFAPFGLSLMFLESIAATIFVTLSGPPESCDAKTPIYVCSSITILVPISWLAATLRAYNVLLLRRPAPDTPLCVQC